MNYDLCVTAVSERADLFVEAMQSMYVHLDQLPSRLIVHEDVRAGSKPGAIDRYLQSQRLAYVHHVSDPARGLGPAMLWCFQQTVYPIALYTQEDYALARKVPVTCALHIMQEHGLNHVRFNQRETMPAKHADKGRGVTPWKKVEVQIDGVTFCISDHWYTQTSLWRVAPAIEAMEIVLRNQTQMNANQFVTQFNKWMNDTHGDGRPWNDQMMRHERLKTYIWGPVGEPAYLRSLDYDASRTTGPKRT